MYLWEKAAWPACTWDERSLARLLAHVSKEQGRLLGKMEALGFDLRSEAHLRTLTEDVVKSSEIEGETLAPDQVRSSIARRLGFGRRRSCGQRYTDSPTAQAIRSVG